MFDVPIDPHVGHSETLADLTSGQVTSIVGNADPVLDRAESSAHAAIGNPCPAFAATAECEGGSGSWQRASASDLIDGPDHTDIRWFRWPLGTMIILKMVFFFFGIFIFGFFFSVFRFPEFLIVFSERGRA